MVGSIAEKEKIEWGQFISHVPPELLQRRGWKTFAEEGSHTLLDAHGGSKLRNSNQVLVGLEQRISVGEGSWPLGSKVSTAAKWCLIENYGHE